jgi:hypothetical protein
LITIGILFATAVGAQTAPTVTLTASPTSGITPFSTTLTWSSTNATTCAASGSWSGTKAVSGSETVTGILVNSTFNLTCSSGTGSATLRWSPPTTNTDGSAIPSTGNGALAGYKLYHATTAAGVASATPVTISGGTTTSYILTGLPAGVRYYGLKATNVAGVDSDMSNSPTNTVNIVSASATASVTVTTKPNPPTLVTVSTAVLDLKRNSTPGRVVGYIPLNAPCVGEPVYKTLFSTYYEVPLDNVVLTTTPRSSIVVAKCAITG